MHTDRTFPAHCRLRSREDFARVYQSDFVAADDVLVIHAVESLANEPRLGLSVSRKVGNAVIRNRWKRRIREAFREVRRDLPPLDLIVRPRKGAKLDYHAIVRSLPQLARRLARKVRGKHDRT